MIFCPMRRVGARSVENQQHRLTASGMDIPVGMKNPTSGDLDVMLNSITAAQHPHNVTFIRGMGCIRPSGNELVRMQSFAVAWINMERIFRTIITRIWHPSGYDLYAETQIWRIRQLSWMRTIPIQDKRHSKSRSVLSSEILHSRRLRSRVSKQMVKGCNDRELSGRRKTGHL